jgi:hypothetical protein
MAEWEHLAEYAAREKLTVLHSVSESRPAARRWTR